MGCEDMFARNNEEIMQTCQQILSVVREKSKQEVNPLLFRIQMILQEFQTHFTALASAEVSIQQQKYHWSILYRDGDTLDEMATMLHNTTPVLIKTEVDYIKQCLVFFTYHIVNLFGKDEARYIITPKFQELAELW